MDDFGVRREQESDYEEISRVICDAFGEEGSAVDELVKLIRSSNLYFPQYSFVAVIDDIVVGHTMLSGAYLIDGSIRHDVLVLSPLSVSPQYQRRGIGAALVKKVIQTAEKSNESLIVLEGDHNYYSRFGFEWSEKYGITIKIPLDVPPECAQIYRGPAFHENLKGRVQYPPAFDHVAH